MGLFALRHEDRRTSRFQILRNSVNYTAVMSNDVAWAVTRNNSKYLLKKRNCPKPFSTDPLNLTNKHSQRYSGLCNSKAIGVAFPVGKKAKCAHKPVKATTTTALKSGPRRAVPTLKRLIHGQRYRKDLTSAALRRASAICRSQKPLPKRKGARAAKAE